MTDKGDRHRMEGKAKKGILSPVSLWSELRAELEESRSFSVLSNYIFLYHLQNLKGDRRKPHEAFMREAFMPQAKKKRTLATLIHIAVSF